MYCYVIVRLCLQKILYRNELIWKKAKHILYGIQRGKELNIDNSMRHKYTYYYYLVNLP